MNTCRFVSLSLIVFLGACAPFKNRDGAGDHAPTPHETADAVPRDEPPSRNGNPAFYDQFGQRYHVLKTAKDYSERGVASWYGKQFHGRRTSNGEIFDMYAMTAAHKTLPIPAYVEVINLRNGKSAVVRVNDRGPFVDNRIIDLSYAAATKLGIVQDGTGLVEIKTVQGKKPSARKPVVVSNAPLVPQGKLFVQVGAFSNQGNAQRLQNRIQERGIMPVIIAAETVADGTIHRVRVGPVNDVAAFDQTIARLRDMGIEDVVLAPE